MLKNIITSYKRYCTRAGQFNIVLNSGIMLSSILTVGTFIFSLIAKYMEIPEDLYIYFYLGSIVLAEFIYIFLISILIYYRKKFYVIIKIKKLIKCEETEQVKNLATNFLKKIKEEKMYNKIKKIFSDKSTYSKVYNSIKFDKFLEEESIDEEKSKKLQEEINDYIKNKKNFKELIDTAFLSTIWVIVLTPIVSYVQSIYIPDTATEINYTNIINYISIIAILIISILCIIYGIRKFNDKKTQTEKELLEEMKTRLADHDFQTNNLKRYIKIK